MRPRRTPLLNLEATSLTSLIAWEDVHEPVFTTSLTKQEVSDLVEVPFPAPAFSVHTQSVERIVKQVTEAAASVVGFEAREGFITARMEHTLAMPKFTTK